MAQAQLEIFGDRPRAEETKPVSDEGEHREELSAKEVQSYERVVVAFSGGKDSISCVLHLMELGVAPSSIELWHHEVDGREGLDDGDVHGLMDWPCTPGYCRSVADALGIEIYFSWKIGGFRREMMREDEKTAGVAFETPEGTVEKVGGNNGKKNTRRMFPQVSASLTTRWCSSYLKVMVASAALRHQPRFRSGRTLFVTGERAEESANRKEYATFEPHRADLRDGKRYERHIDHWRPVHGWSEEEVWDIIRRWSIRPHPAYVLGWGRVSCMTCIFGSANQWATVKTLDPDRFEEIAQLEEEFGVTIHRTKSVRELAAIGVPYDDINPDVVSDALDPEYSKGAIVETWSEPPGAYGESCGPI